MHTSRSASGKSDTRRNTRRNGLPLCPLVASKPRLRRGARATGSDPSGTYWLSRPRAASARTLVPPARTEQMPDRRSRSPAASARAGNIPPHPLAPQPRPTSVPRAPPTRQFGQLRYLSFSAARLVVRGRDRQTAGWHSVMTRASVEIAGAARASSKSAGVVHVADLVARCHLHRRPCRPLLRHRHQRRHCPRLRCCLSPRLRMTSRSRSRSPS